jgi:diguanylate cyclase (GGDEF)-like protein
MHQLPIQPTNGSLDGYAIVDLTERRLVWESGRFRLVFLESNELLFQMIENSLQENPENFNFTTPESCMVTTERLSIEGRPLLLVAVRWMPVTATNGNLTLSFDPLTGIADRRAIESRLQELSQLGGSTWQNTGLLFIDLDGFKQINDKWGHLVGDEVLCIVSQRLSESIRNNDLLARFGGDEFVVLAEGVETLEELGPLAKRLAGSVAHPLNSTAGTHQLSASIGAALGGEVPPSPRDLLNLADRRMYAQKNLTGT